MMKFKWIALTSLVWLCACGGSSRKRHTNHLQTIQQMLAGSKEYSVILEDMKVEGNFMDEYFHKYKLIVVQKIAGKEDDEFKETTTDWYQVSQQQYQDL